MLIGKLKYGKMFHVIRSGGADPSASIPESYCGKMFFASCDDLVEDVAVETVRERQLCKQCEKALAEFREKLAARQEKWAVAVRAALDDERITLDHWNRYFHNEQKISFYADPGVFHSKNDYGIIQA